MLIYKIFRPSEAAALISTGTSTGAPLDFADGYIHFSTAATLAATAAKHFAGEDNLKLLAIEADTLGDALRWEPARGGVLFPHLYRELKGSDVVWTKEMPLKDDVHAIQLEG